MNVDRKYQLEILNTLAESYPQRFDHRQFCRDMDENTEKKFVSNIAYLVEHGLVDSKISDDGRIDLPKITASGIDFLANDGGLSAILDVVTIRFDDATIRALIETKIAQSSQSPEDKKKLLSQLQSLPSDSIKHLTMKLLDKGLESLPEASLVIQSILQSLS